MFAAMADRCATENETRAAAGAGRLLLELLEVPDEYSSSDGTTLFWGEGKPKSILTNNS
jgi:hypothetical protein